MSMVVITMNIFASGVLLSVLEDMAAWQDGHPLHKVYWQLVAAKKQIEKHDGVKKILLQNGMVLMVDDEGNMIQREAMRWEKQEMVVK